MYVFAHMFLIALPSVRRVYFWFMPAVTVCKIGGPQIGGSPVDVPIKTTPKGRGGEGGGYADKHSSTSIVPISTISADVARFLVMHLARKVDRTKSGRPDCINITRPIAGT